MRFSVDQPEKETVYYNKNDKQSGVVIDFFMLSMFVIITIALIATFFINFDMNAEFNIKKATPQALWFALGSFCSGELAKRIFRRKGEKTEEFIKAENEACEAIKAVNLLGENAASNYCAHATLEVIKRFRSNTLIAVGIFLETYETEYIGKGAWYLFKRIKSGELSYLQAKAILKCNKAKIKLYNPRFITSYNSEDRFDIVPSEQHNTKKADLNNTIQKFIFSIGTAFGVGFIFYDVVINFSAEMVFLAIVKIIAMAIGTCLNASFGWNLALMDMRRNRLRKSEADACCAYIASEEKKNVGEV